MLVRVAWLGQNSPQKKNELLRRVDGHLIKIYSVNNEKWVIESKWRGEVEANERFATLDTIPVFHAQNACKHNLVSGASPLPLDIRRYKTS